MTRRSFLRLSGRAAASWAAAGFACAAPRPRRNVLFLSVDDLRPQLGCYGHVQMRSPHMDRLARDGSVFLRAYCQQALCAPSRASLLTGLRPPTTGVFTRHIHFRDAVPDVVTLPQQFKRHGYHARSFGKILHGRQRDPASWSEPSWRPYRAFADRPVYALPENQALRRTRRFGPPVESADVPDERYADGLLVEQALGVLRDPGRRPFFLAVGFYKPHLPFAAPRRFFDLYPPDAVDLADNPVTPRGAPAIALMEWAEVRQYHGMPAEGPLPDDLARELIRGYYACVSYIDAQIGRLLDELDRLDLRRDTVIVLWGDHGFHLGENGLWGKHTSFETAVRSPLIVSAPGQLEPGRRTLGLTEFVDIYPSLCELCELPAPPELEGTSFVPLMEDPQRAWKRAAFSHCTRRSVMGETLRTDRYRFTRWRWIEERPDELELYDHERDPHETRNLAGDPAQAARTRELGAALDAGWRAALPSS